MSSAPMLRVFASQRNSVLAANRWCGVVRFISEKKRPTRGKRESPLPVEDQEMAHPDPKQKEQWDKNRKTPEKMADEWADKIDPKQKLPLEKEEYARQQVPR
eukprot:GILK01017799.1.p1 GENE.GILK01017799.1~~GILK01017799.1.p1  ORF type:complete len:102 (-),score=12.12 GILK01017799.1:87-392(-)